MGIWVNGEKFEGVYNEDSVVGSLVCRDWRIGAMSRLFFFSPNPVCIGLTG